MPADKQPQRNTKPPDWKLSGKPGYALLTESEKWKHHTHVYAFRIVYLGAPETQRTWDGDPEGAYFDADLIATEISRLQAKKDRQDGSARRRAYPDDPRDDPHVKAQRAAWIKLKGYPSWQACLDAMWQDAVDHAHPVTGQPEALGALQRSGLLGFCAEWRARLVRQRMGSAERKPLTARELGVTVTEHRSPLASYPDDPT